MTPADATSVRPRVGLVLGAGGVGGAAFHAGTLLALETDLGWDPRTAEVVVGTSAGSIVGTLLRAGFSTEDLAAWASQVPASHDGQAGRDLLEEMAGTPTRVRPRLHGMVGRRRVLAEALRARVHPLTAVMALLPFGFLDAQVGLSRLDELVPHWPEARLWITAVRTRDGSRTVLTGDQGESVGRAVAASCAIPGVFNPVRVGGHEYVDGGAASPTNADLLLGAGVEVVVILSAMSGAAGPAATGLLPTPERLMRRVSRRRLETEVDLLERAGLRVHVIEPSPSTAVEMGLHPLDRARTPPVVRQAFVDAARQFTWGLVRDLRPLPAKRPARPSPAEWMFGPVRQRETQDDEVAS